MRDPLRVRLSGPLQEFGLGFVVELERQGYSPLGTNSGRFRGNEVRLWDYGAKP